MTFVGRIGQGVHTRPETTFEWSIQDFFSLSDQMDHCYRSPVFCFDGARWYLELFPNGETEGNTDGWTGLYLLREDTEESKTIHYKVGIKTSSGEVEVKKDETHVFSPQYLGLGFPTFWMRCELWDEMSRLMPDNVLTISCHMKRIEPIAASTSLCDRVWEVSRNMRRILSSGRRSDFSLKVASGREWRVHRAVLESRSEYFEHMFRHEGWAENASGQAQFEDLGEEAMSCVLDFVYTGVVRRMSSKNVCDVYVAAHKFLIEGLKALCVEFMKGNMSADIVCRVYVIAVTYEEESLGDSAVEFFIREIDRIFDSEEWKELKKCHSSVATELLEESTKRERKRRT